VGLIARAIEEQGVPTVCVVMNGDIAENVGIPRALYVRFPYGAPLGPAGAAEFQMSVVRAALDVLVTAPHAGSIIESDLEWPE
jgi:hypothetical protein